MLGLFALFFWLPVPPALHQITEALGQPQITAQAAGQSTGIRHDVLAWLNTQLHQLPSGSQVLHPVAAYEHNATDAVVAAFFTLAPTWYWVLRARPHDRPALGSVSRVEARQEPAALIWQSTAG